MKLALLARRGIAAKALLAGQRAVLDRIAADRAGRDGFAVVLVAWRHANVTAALRFLDEIEPVIG